MEAVGPGVDSSWLGKTASTVPAFPANVYGVYGEIAIVPASDVAEYPAHLSYEEGASNETKRSFFVTYPNAIENKRFVDTTLRGELAS